MSQNLLIKISGPDHPGITAKIMENLVEHNAKLRDMGQSITHGLLSLSVLVTIENKEPLLKDMLFHAKDLNVQLDYQEVEIAETNSSQENYIISCVSPEDIQAGFFQDLSSVLAQHEINIKRIDNLNPSNFKTLDLTVEVLSPVEKIGRVKRQLLSLSQKHALDIALLKDNVWRRNKRLIVFDMDSTLIQSEVIVEMAKAHGVGDEVHKITESAMNGEINFDESLEKRVSLLKGLDESKLKDILKEIKLTEGVEEFISTVQKLGYKTAIISGGFTFFAKEFQKRLGIDYVFANDLVIESGTVTGKIKGEIINAKQKAILLEMLAQQENINLEQVVAIGDGANDLPMLSKAGLGIAFHAKDIVKQNAKQHMSYGNMASILYFLGITKQV